jgi:hypothetical protein
VALCIEVKPAQRRDNLEDGLTVPSPIDAALPLTLAVASSVPPSPAIVIVTVPSALLWPPASEALLISRLPYWATARSDVNRVRSND